MMIEAETETLPAVQRPYQPSAIELVQIAMQSGMSPDVIQQMMDLQDREQKRLARMAFSKAISLAKQELRPIVKNASVSFPGKGGQTSYTHETLQGIEEQVMPTLVKHGLSYRFRTDNAPDRPISVTCILEHEDGHYEETTLAAGADSSGGKNSIQAVGSTVTYLQRYTVKAALGLSVAKDDDGRQGIDSRPAPDGGPGTIYSQSNEPHTLTPEMEATLRDSLDAVNADMPSFLKAFKIERLELLPVGQYETAMSMVRKKQEKMKEGAR